MEEKIYKVLLFGITKDIIGKSEINIKQASAVNVEEFLNNIKEEYPGLKKLKSLLVAVNNEYAKKNQLLLERDEIALIPPVSGG